MAKSKTYKSDPALKAISKMFNVSSRYVRMIIAKQRNNDQILKAYLKLKKEIAEVIEKANKDHRTPDSGDKDKSYNL